jgi:hypothetical protein
MHSFNFTIALLFALIGFSVAFPGFHPLEARKGDKEGDKGGKNSTSMSNSNSLTHQCKTMSHLTHLTTLAANQTKLDAMVAKDKLNATSVAELKTKASDAATKLQTLSTNTTLVSECAVVDANMKTMGQCKQMKSLTKLAALSGNSTAMDAWVAKKKLNDTQVAKLKEKITKAGTKLDALKGNATLLDICSKAVKQQSSDGG